MKRFCLRASQNKWRSPFKRGLNDFFRSEDRRAKDLDTAGLEVSKMKLSCLYNEGTEGHMKALSLKGGGTEAEEEIKADSIQQSQIQKWLEIDELKNEETNAVEKKSFKENRLCIILKTNSKFRR